MNTSENVLERKVIPPGKPFIKAGEEHARAYIVQTGSIQAYIMEGDKKIIVQTYGPGRIIGEICLMSDEPMTMNYEATENSTVVTLTRAEFQKKISKMDKNVSTILEHVMNKLNFQYAEDIDKAKQSSMQSTILSSGTDNLIQAIIGNIESDERAQYEAIMLPHLQAMLRDITAYKNGEEVKEEEKDVWR